MARMTAEEKKMKAQEAKWAAENDAQTLARAEEIKSDPARRSKARMAARRLVIDVEKSVRGLKKVIASKSRNARSRDI